LVRNIANNRQKIAAKGLSPLSASLTLLNSPPGRQVSTIKNPVRDAKEPPFCRPFLLLHFQCSVFPQKERNFKTVGLSLWTLIQGWILAPLIIFNPGFSYLFSTSSTAGKNKALIKRPMIHPSYKGIRKLLTLPCHCDNKRKIAEKMNRDFF
jgi:hypothetical protein